MGKLLFQDELAAELGMSVEMVQAAKRLGMSLGQAKEYAAWLFELPAHKRELFAGALTKASGRR